MIRTRPQISLIRSVLPKLLMQLGALAIIGGILATRGENWSRAIEIAAYLFVWLGAICTATLIIYQRGRSKRRVSASPDTVVIGAPKSGAARKIDREQREGGTSARDIDSKIALTGSRK